MASYLILAATALILLYLYFTRHFSHWKNRDIPFVKPLPFFGNVISGITMRQCMGEIFYDLYRKSSEPILGFFVLDRPCLLVRSPEIIKRILVTDFQNFFDRSVYNNKRDDPIGSYNLFFLKNPDWKDIRSKITPIFTSSKMKTMSTLIKDASDEMIEYLEGKIRSDPVVEMKEVCIKFTVDVITSTTFGVYGHSFKDENSRFFLEAKKIINWDDFWTSFRIRCYFLAHTLVKIFRMTLFNPESVKFLAESFWKIMDQRVLSKNRRNDLIDIMLQMKNDDKNFIGGDILAAQAVVFFTAGFETSSSTISYVLYELACHPEIQKKLRDEIIEVERRNGDLNYHSLKEMDYLEMCIKELLRKRPVIPFLERHCNSDYVLRLRPETGTVIDKGISVFISTLSLHHDPHFFPNPEKFDPERFSKENKHKIDPFSYLPFGEGPRNCIGGRFGMMSVKFALASIIKNFNVETCSQTQENIKYNPNGLVLSALEGIRLKLVKI